NKADSSSGISDILTQLDLIYNWNLFMLLPFVVILWGAFKKLPTVPIMLLSSILAVIIGVFSNQFNFVDGMTAMVDGFNTSMINDFKVSELSETVISLIERGGIFSMTTIVVTIFCGYAFAGIVEVSGCLDVILEKFSGNIESPPRLIGATIIS